MEATGSWDGRRGPSWSYRRRHGETGCTTSYTTSSSRSGTIVSSTACTSSGRLSSISMQLELGLELDVSTESETLKEKRMKRIESLVQEFFRGQSAENHSTKGGADMGVLESWFSELHVSRVPQLDVGAPAWVLGHPTVVETWRWTRALTQIMETIRLTTSFFSGSGHGHGFVGSITGVSEEEPLSLENLSGKQASSLVDPLQFALFFQETMSKMLVFVDVMFSKPLSICWPPCTSNLLVSCLRVHGALSRALSAVRLQFHLSPSAEVEKVGKEMVSLLLTKQGKVFEEIWSTMEEIRTYILKSMEYLLGTQTPQGSSSHIHEATHLVMDHINFLLCHHTTVSPLVSEAASLGKYVPQTGLGEALPFAGLITEMVSCLEEKLITKSQLFLGKGLGLLFLLNNSNFIWEKLVKYPFSYIKGNVAAVITLKVKHYIESYVQVSWASMLSCLSNPAPLCLGTNYSPLSKFESEFQKIYTTQKLWQVPDPGLRKSLRKAVTEKIIPGYIKYIEDSKVTNPKFTPQELKEMLQELFEG